MLTSPGGLHSGYRFKMSEGSICPNDEERETSLNQTEWGESVYYKLAECGNLLTKEGQGVISGLISGMSHYRYFTVVTNIWWK